MRLAQKKCYKFCASSALLAAADGSSLTASESTCSGNSQTPAWQHPALKGGHNRDEHAMFPRRPKRRRTTELPQSASPPLSLPATLALTPSRPCSEVRRSPSCAQIAWFGDPGHLSVKRQKTRPVLLAIAIYGTFSQLACKLTCKRASHF